MTTVDGGRAVVTVVTRASAASLAATGALIEKKLEESAKRSGNVFERQFNISLGRGAVVLGRFTSFAAPAASIISQLGAGVVALGAALQQTSLSVVSATGVLGSLFQGLQVGKLAFGSFFKAINAQTLDQFKTAVEKLPPAARQAATAMFQFREALRIKLSTAVFDGLEASFRRLGAAVGPVLDKQLTRTATTIHDTLASLAGFGASTSFVERFNTVLGSNNRIFSTLAKAVQPFLDGMLNLLVALGPSAERLAVSIGKLATRFQEWTSQAGFAERIDGTMKKAQTTAGLLLSVIGHLAKALGAVFTAAAPAGNEFLKMLDRTFIRFNNFARSASGKSQIAAWVDSGISSMRELGHTLALLGKAFAALADPAVFTALLKIIESFANTMATLAPLLASTAKALGFFAPIVGPAIAFTAVISSLTLQTKILGAVLRTLGLTELAQGFLSSAAAASEATGIMGTAGGKLARVVDGIRLQTKALGGPGLFAAARTQFAAFGSFVVGLGPKIISGLRAIGLALRVAFVANPVGVIITGLILLGTALFVLYKKSETFRNAVNAVWGAIKVAAAATVEWFTKTALPALQNVWDAIVAGASAVGGFFATIWGGIVTAFRAVWGFLMAAWTAVGAPIFAIIKAAIMLWVKSLEIVWKLIEVAFALVWFGLKLAWEKIGVPLFNFIKAYIDAWIAGIGLVWALLKIAWEAIWNAMQAVWQAVGVPLVNAIQKGWAVFVAALGVVWGKLKAAWKVVWDGIVIVWNTVGKPVFDKIMAVWAKVKSAAQTITTAIKNFFVGMWDGVVKAATSAMSGLIGVMNKIIAGVNKIITATNTATGSHIGTIKPIPLATGVRNFRGGVALVGEQGPELVNLPRGANVYSNRETQRMAETGGFTQVNNYYGPTTGSDRKREWEWAVRFAPRGGAPSAVTAG